jgi:hypothetical protein
MARTTTAPTPMLCPVCGDTVVGQPGNPKGDLTGGFLTTEQAMCAHFERHKPTQPCPHRDSHTGGPGHEPYWVLDMDLVRHPRPDVSYFYCHPCGYYAPIEPA